jgi:MFS family permease
MFWARAGIGKVVTIIGSYARFSKMRRYRHILRGPFGRLWLGSTISNLGDGMTWLALAWLVYTRTGSARDLGLLTFAYGAPVVVGGLAAGWLLDRFDPSKVLIIDSIVRGVLMGSVPLVNAVAHVPLWQLYAVASVYGLMKMFPLAGVPALVPELADEEQLSTANALESLSYTVSGVAGPAAAGLLIAATGAANVLAFDAFSFFVFAGLLGGIRLSSGEDRAETNVGIGAALRFVVANRPIRATTLMFALYNLGFGGFIVLLPVYTRQVLGAGPGTYGLLLSVLTCGELLGALAVGAIDWKRSLARTIAATQLAVGATFLVLTAKPSLAIVLPTLGLVGVLSAPLTIWAQTLRMRAIPPQMRGRVFALLRTTMQAATPAGAAASGALLATIGIAPLAFAIAACVGLPGGIGLVHPDLSEGQEHAIEAA